MNWPWSKKAVVVIGPKVEQEEKNVVVMKKQPHTTKVIVPLKICDENMWDEFVRAHTEKAQNGHVQIGRLRARLKAYCDYRGMTLPTDDVITTELNKRGYKSTFYGGGQSFRKLVLKRRRNVYNQSTTAGQYTKYVH